MYAEHAPATTTTSDPPASPPNWHTAVTQRRPAPPLTSPHADEASWRAEALAARQRAEQAEQRAEEAEQRTVSLENALGSRAAIDQAKGAIMAVFGLGADDAFESLVWVSQHANIKLATIAEQFIDDVRGIELGKQASEALTHTLAHLAGLSRK